MTTAVGHKDADAIVARLTPTFTGEGGIDRAEVSAELRRHFSLYESVEIGLAEVATERQPGGATVRFRAAFAGKPKNIGGLAGLLPDAARYRFELTLVGEGTDLKVSRASWQPAERPQ
jgi:hypothetical protein